MSMIFGGESFEAMVKVMKNTPPLFISKSFVV